MIILIFDSFISFSLSSLLIVLLSDVIDITWKLTNMGNLIRTGSNYDYRTNNPIAPHDNLKEVTNIQSRLDNNYTTVHMTFKPKVNMKIAYDGTKFPTKLRSYKSIERYGSPDTDRPFGSGGGFYPYRGKESGNSYKCGYKFA